MLRPNRIARQIGLGGERTAALGQRLARIQRSHLAERRKHLQSLARVLESSSYRSALERGFALVRGEDGHVRRRAAAVAPGERLTLTFADGEQAATADGPAPPKPKAQTQARRPGESVLIASHRPGCHGPRMRAHPVGFCTMSDDFAPHKPATRRKASPGWPAFAGHDTEFMISSTGKRF